jgi:hypothetical protein
MYTWPPIIETTWYAFDLCASPFCTIKLLNSSLNLSSDVIIWQPCPLLLAPPAFQTSPHTSVTIKASIKAL